MSRRNSDAGRMAVVWLATVVIIVIGAFASAFVIFASTEQVQVPMTIWGCSFTGLFLVLFLMNMRWEEPINQLKFWLSWSDRNDPTDGYRAARRSIEMREQYGTQAPPSVESVRDAQDHGGAWVPRSSSGKRSRSEKSP